METNATLLPAFPDPVTDAQAAFRTIMRAMAEPGQPVTLEAAIEVPEPLSASAGAIALSLCDVDTAVWLDEELAAAAPVVEWLTFHTGAQLTHDPAASDFAFVSAPQTMPPLSAFAEGTPDYPDRSTTVVMQVHAWSGVNVVLSGPGIRTQVAFAAAPLHDDFWQRARENHARFPLGVDLLFTTRDEIAGLPRSTRINGEGE